MPIFGDRLREAREQLGLSQQAMADRCGVTMRSQRNYEKGERLPDADYFVALVNLGLNVEFLLTGNPAVLIAQSLRDAQAEIAQFTELLYAGKARPEAFGIGEPRTPYGDRETVLLGAFAQLDEAGKAAVESMINALLTKK